MVSMVYHNDFSFKLDSFKIIIYTITISIRITIIIMIVFLLIHVNVIW